MRRFKAFLSMLLICVFLLPCCIAQGETCYLYLRDLFSADRDTAWYLGEGTIVPAEVDKAVSVLYITDLERFGIFGTNESGEGETTVWSVPDTGNTIAALLRICSGWEELEQMLDEGYKLSLTIADNHEEAPSHIITDAETAADFAAYLKEKYSSVIQEE